jgi:hypothetical protein
MKSGMRFLGLAIAVVVLAALSGVLYWSNHRKPATDTSVVNANAAPVILNDSAAAITTLTVKPKSEPAVSLTKAGSDTWQITAPKDVAADQDSVTQLLGYLSPLKAERVVSENGSNLGAFGLAQPTVELDITEKNHAAQKLLVGDDTPTGDAAYAMVEGDPRVFTVLSYDKSGLNKGLESLRDKRLMNLTLDKIHQIDLTHGGESLEFLHKGSDWQIEKPGPYRADPMAAGTLADTLSTTQMNLNQPTGQAADAAFARGSLVATVDVMGPAGKQTLEVKKDKDNYYAQSSYAQGIYQVDASLATELTKKLEDFRDKSVFDFRYNDPNEVDMENESQEPGSVTKSWNLARNGEDWQQAGKKMDADSCEAVVSALRSLTATKFVSSGFTTPEITATVKSNNGARVEKVSIAKAGGEYLAKRENEPTIYVLDAGAVEGLEKAENGVHPAATAKK